MSEKEIRVLLIAYACEPYKGSEPGVGWNWALHLSKYCNLSVITRENNKASIENWLRYNKSFNNTLKFYYVDLPKPLLFLKKCLGIWFYYYCWQLWVLFYYNIRLRGNRYDLVHHVSFMSNKVNITPFLGIKSIVGPVGGLELLPKGFYLFTGHPIKEFFRNLLIKRYKHSPLYNFYLKKVNRLILTSCHNIYLINRKFHNKISVMQIGSNEIVPPQNEQNVNSKIIQLYWGGILERWKGLELLLMSLTTIKNEFHLSITGKGKDESYFKELAIKLGLHKKITFHGWLDYEKLNSLKQNTDIFIFTSLRETTGSILLEMMGRCKACVVLNIGGPSEICNNNNSLKIDVKNVSQVISDLSKAIDFLIENPNERKKIASRAFEDINKNYNWDIKAKRMIEIYKEILNENSASA